MYRLRRSYLRLGRLCHYSVDVHRFIPEMAILGLVHTRLADTA